MITHAFAIYDRVAETYNTPFFIPQVPMAKRVFSNCVIDGENQIHKNPADYVLCEIGTFDDNTGVFTPLTAPQEILDATEVLELHYAAEQGRFPVSGVNPTSTLKG